MSTVTIHNPSEVQEQKPLPSSNPSSVTVKDSTGRSITIQEPNVLNESRLVRAMGDAASNAAYMTAYILPAAMVTAINGDPVIFPYSALAVENTIQRLGREGMGAIMDHIIAKAEAATKAGPTGDLAEIKK